MREFTFFLTIAAMAMAANADQPAERNFAFTYGATVVGLDPGARARIWLPVPPTNEDQEAALVTQNLPPRFVLGTEPKYGNLILYTEPQVDGDGTVQVSVTYQIRRREVQVSPEAGDASRAELFLQPDAKVPIGGKPLTLLAGHDLPDDQVALGRLLYDVVNDHMRYSKEGTGWGQGDAVWACDSKYGNCSDFHSLFISLSRSNRIPAKFEIGFPLPEQRGSGEIAGYHCWAKFKPAGKGWIPVDISEANKNPALRDYYFGNLTADRVTFTVGRDLVLVPKQDGPPLNFFIYPYVEVDGKPYPSDKVQRKLLFRDLKH
jgi:transglutaminase-like putative cysteine protease